MNEDVAAPHPRRVFANRTLNLRRIKAIGYDMDYTLIHYDVDTWERRAYEHVRGRLVELGWPVGHLDFDPERMIRGLVIDVQTGNTLKATRFGYVVQARHGTERLSFEQMRETYARTLVDLSEDRFVFLNTLFSISEGWIYAQLVDLLDRQGLPGVMGYEDLYNAVRCCLDQTHMEGELKAEIIQDPDRFVQLDPDAPLALLDQKHAGKRLLLITNSEWPYTSAMMSYAFDPFLPGEMTWRELFDVIIVAARKPAFFAGHNPLFEVVSEAGLLRPCVGGLLDGEIHLGGNAEMVENHLGISGSEILYVGDHLYTDVQISKRLLRWRTALVLRELEQELEAIDGFERTQQRLSDLMARKEQLEQRLARRRLEAQRIERDYGPPPARERQGLADEINQLREALVALDAQVAPLARESGQLSNPHWGLLLRAGNDKSYLTRQLERHADVYTSRVSNFGHPTPFGFLRAPRGTMPHDQS